MTAMLGMYDMPALRPVNDRLWQSVRADLGFGPADLTRDRDFWQVWRDPSLVLAQTCGMPYRVALHDTVQLVGTPDYGLPGCAPGQYRSVLLVRADSDAARAEDAAGGVLAYNEALSQSGWAALATHLSGRPVRFRALLETGAHAASARAVLDGRADLAALDALTWQLLQAHEPWTAGLRVIEATAPTPCLPFITAQGQDAPAMAAALRRAIAAMPPADRALLPLRALMAPDHAAYLAVPTPPGPDAGHLLNSTPETAK